MEQDIKNLISSVDVISKNTLKILERVETMEGKMVTMEGEMVTKEELRGVESTLTKKIDQVSTDLNSFKTETRDNFEKLSIDIKDNKESVEAVVVDYHPHIIALEEKVFGHSTLAES